MTRLAVVCCLSSRIRSSFALNQKLSWKDGTNAPVSRKQTKKQTKIGPAAQNYFTCSSNQLFLLKTVLLQPLTMLTCLSRNFTCLKGNFTILLLVCYLLCSPAWVGISPPSPVWEEISPFFGLFAIYYGHLSEKKFHLSDRKFHHALACLLFTNTMLTCQEEI